MSRRTLPALLVLALSLACGGPKEDPVLRLSAAESLTEGKSLLERERWTEARRYLTHAYEVEPNSATGREALLLVADAYYEEGGTQNAIQAEAKYRDFLNRFPTSEAADYAQFQIGKAISRRLERPDRDQTATHEALAAFRDLIRLYPDSEYVDEAEERIAELRQRLAEHEFRVAFFYFRYGLPAATAGRLEYLLEHYPEYQNMDKVYYYLGMAQRRRGQEEEAEEWFARLRQQYPESGYVAEIPDLEGDEEEVEG